MKRETYNYIFSFLGVAILRMKVREDAEDLLQDVAIKIWQCIEWFEALPEEEKRAIILTSIHNRHVDMKRRKKAIRRTPDFTFMDKVTEPDIFAKMELKDVLKKAQERPLICRSLLLWVEGYSLKEIYKIEKLKNINTAIGRCGYARKFLRA